MDLEQVNRHEATSLSNISEFELLLNMDSLKKVADVILKSKTFTNLTTQEEVVTALALGRELGINPITACILGKRLNRNAIQSILIGRNLGLDFFTAMDNIHIISTSKGDVTVTGIHIITALLNRAGVIIEYPRDYAPLCEYKEIILKGSGNNIKFEFGALINEVDVEKELDKFHIVNSSTSKEEIIKLSKERRILYDGGYRTFGTTCRLTRHHRKATNVVEITYTLREATDAGLYRGVNSITGETVKGKDNWNLHYKTMLRNRPTAIAGRIIASDLLKGVYEYSEIPEAENIK